MLIFNLNPIFIARGIKKPSQYLIKTLKISPATATDIKLGRAKTITLRHLELLCTQLNCTPNDLLAWVPEKGVDTTNHPMNALIPTEREELTQYIQTLPYPTLKHVMNILKGQVNEVSKEIKGVDDLA